MLVAELTGVRRFRLHEQDVDEPGPGEVRVRVEAVGICGSDMHSYLEGSVGDTPCVCPMVLGHEPAGVVVKPERASRAGNRVTAPHSSRRSIAITANSA